MESYEKDRGRADMPLIFLAVLFCVLAGIGTATAFTHPIWSGIIASIAAILLMKIIICIARMSIATVCGELRGRK